MATLKGCGHEFWWDSFGLKRDKPESKIINVNCNRKGDSYDCVKCGLVIEFNGNEFIERL